ncbi:DNA repair protein RecN [Halobacteriovorax sp. GB3]|uniref:DNA repair protein RecN n=1 Tax=Halobacteriovorax sp. GB3 TaxID=2719615 RepID=UPI00235EC1EE|nr:DNA repair protein RecN [Halobacteriovorax sp. GB3]MDD0854640.1 DNA repair protein RecN [Halobacteriovorax sp. GB3]
MDKTLKLSLETVSIKNFATFEDQTINFSGGFNSIVGETGSGKSLILDAIQLLLGARADRKLVRKDSEFATIEATFIGSSESTNRYFDDIGYPTEDDITIKRVIYANGKSKSFLNYQSCPLSALQTFSKKFIDLVGQFENQKLLSNDYQLILLDSYANLKNDVDKYQIYFSKYNDLLNKRDELLELNASRIQREEFVKFQINEIEKLSPEIGEEENLISKKESILNYEKNINALQVMSEIISDGDTNILALIHQCKNLSSQTSHDFSSLLEEIKSNVEQLSYEVSKNIDQEPLDESIDDIIDRLDLYQKLKRKFGGSIEAILEEYENLRKELNELNESEINLHNICAQIEDTKNKAYALAQEIHEKRSKATSKLSQALTKSVRQLKMDGATFDIKIQESQTMGPRGISSLIFMAETNPGEGYFAIKDIASGGELSRILLSLRQILSSNESISVFLFDEIDTGVGGETALAIGKSLYEVSKNSQVIAITHLPQIASFSDKLILVSKSSHNKRTISKVEEITGKNKREVIELMAPLN